MTNNITVDSSKCNGCMLCMQVCMLGNFEPGDDKKVHPAEGLSCFACGHCVAVCPTQALTHIALTPCEPLDENARPSYDQFLEFLKMRRSRREFKDEPVPRDVIDKLLAAAVEAPSSLNNQSVQYTIVTDPVILKQISETSAEFIRKTMAMMRNPLGKLFFRIVARADYEGMQEFLPLMDCLLAIQDSGKDMVLYDAPCLIFLHAPKSDICAPADAIFNAENILLAAETLGLGACVIGMVTEPANRGPEIKRLAQIPADHTVFSSIILGFPKFKYKHSAPKNPPVVKFV